MRGLKGALCAFLIVAGMAAGIAMAERVGRNHPEATLDQRLDEAA